MEDFELLQRAILEAVEVLKLVAGDVEELEVGHALQPPLVPPVLRAMLDEQSLKSVVAQFQDLELG